MGVFLRQRDASTRSALGRLVQESNKASFLVRFTHLYNLASIRNLLTLCIFATPDVTKPQAFRICKDPSDRETKVQMQYRSYEAKGGTIDRCSKI